MLWRMGLRRLLALRGCSVRAQASVVNLQPCSERRGETVRAQICKEWSVLHTDRPCVRSLRALRNQRRRCRLQVQLCQPQGERN